MSSKPLKMRRERVASATARSSFSTWSRLFEFAPAIGEPTRSDERSNDRIAHDARVDGTRRTTVGDAQPRVPDPKRSRPGDRRLALRGQPVAGGQGWRTPPHR